MTTRPVRKTYALHELNGALKASSMPIRCHEANREGIESGEIRDCVTVVVDDLEVVVTAVGKKSLEVASSATLLLL